MHAAIWGFGMKPAEPKLDDLYREVVLDHYRHPRGKHVIETPNVANEGHNPVCGDQVKIALKIREGVIEDAQVISQGCSISVASGSILAEQLKGKSVSAAQQLFAAFSALMKGELLPDDVDLGDLMALEGVKQFPIRIKCALLPWMTTRDALNAYETGQVTPAEPTTTEGAAK